MARLTAVIRRRNAKVGEQAAYAALDSVPDRSDGFDTLISRAVELSVQVPLAGEDRAGVCAATGADGAVAVRTVG
ncbi:hypothetical protein BFF78_19645 [Streptomyces fodineus]|uniref:Uncharacterized protein n=1 Tax=Streptomyces fodineus TaxID=1904616 RepID=A0A1D7YBI6_9ACTN|nr:hypothetical protein BFF78_19645 [Streptomyces fodineus]